MVGIALRRNGKRPARMLLTSPKHPSISGQTLCQGGQSRSSDRALKDRFVNQESRGPFVALTIYRIFGAVKRHPSLLPQSSHRVRQNSHHLILS